MNLVNEPCIIGSGNNLKPSSRQGKRSKIPQAISHKHDLGLDIVREHKNIAIFKK